ncbi:MAG: rhodanese-like domain-containing protein [Methylococcales bacterium]|nr:rhodanese-like domain-containing protein [Methylococcales bacterium]
MKIKAAFILLLSLFSFFVFAEGLVNLMPEKLLEMQKNDNALVVDIRTKKEWASMGTIPNSHKLEFFSSNGRYDLDKWLSDLEKLKASPEQAVILVCRSGSRSGMVGGLLVKKQNMKNIYHLSKGISAWIKAGHNVTKD